MKGLKPQALRDLFRSGQAYLQHTNGSCPGHLQTNIVIIPKDVAGEFEQYCRSNSSSCPLIFKSNPGQVTAPLIGDDVDIRTDLSAYRVLRNGEIVDTVSSLEEVAWDDMVTFHLGCSFSFDSKLLAVGIQLSQEDNIHMYKTNIKTIPVPPFNCDLVVSMRQISPAQLLDAVTCTADSDYAHGAPIHIGNPQAIGIDLTATDILGGVAQLDTDKIPVFWACGVTSGYAVKNAKLEKSFSHSPGCMFVADVESDKVPDIISNTVYPEPTVLKMSKANDYHVILSKNALNALREVEKETLEDLGNRGISELLVADDFVRACISLSQASAVSNVGIILGFPLFKGEKDPIEENDGVAGALYIGKALAARGTKVTFIIDSWSDALKKCLQDENPAFEVKSLGLNYSGDGSDNILLDAGTGKPVFSHLVAIERPSPAVDGICHGMRGQVIDIEPTHILFEQASKHGITTIGIGDGGNELGMGKVRPMVLKHVPKGDLIGSSVSCDYLVTAGVSNWGGFAVAAGLCILSGCPLFDRYNRNGIGYRTTTQCDDFMLTGEKNEELNKGLASKGFRDGVKHNADVLSIDGLDYYDVHVAKFDKIRSIAKKFVEDHK